MPRRIERFVFFLPKTKIPRVYFHKRFTLILPNKKNSGTREKLYFTNRKDSFWKWRRRNSMNLLSLFLTLTSLEIEKIAKSNLFQYENNFLRHLLNFSFTFSCFRIICTFWTKINSFSLAKMIVNLIWIYTPRIKSKSRFNLEIFLCSFDILFIKCCIIY